MKAAVVIRRSALHLITFGVGAGAMYLLDPDSGGRRRDHLFKQVSDWLRTFRKDQPSETQSLAVTAISDTMLLDLLRAELEDCIAHASLLTITVHERRVIVSGPVRGGEAALVEQCLRRLPGVTGFQLSLNEYERESDMPGLPGQRVWEERFSWT